MKYRILTWANVAGFQVALEFEVLKSYEEVSCHTLFRKEIELIYRLHFLPF